MAKSLDDFGDLDENVIADLYRGVDRQGLKTLLSRTPVADAAVAGASATLLP